MNKKDKMWNKAIKTYLFDEDKIRIGAAGALISYDQYGTQEEYGWNIDHRNPNDGNSDDNLRAMHWENNQSKDDDYPCYSRVIVFVPQIEDNNYIEKTICVSDKINKDE